MKGTAEDLRRLSESEQVARYVERYGLVMVTNLRGFGLVGRGEDGAPRMLEKVELGKSEAEFWAAADHPRIFAEERGTGLTEFEGVSVTYLELVAPLLVLSMQGEGPIASRIPPGALALADEPLPLDSEPGLQMLRDVLRPLRFAIS